MSDGVEPGGEVGRVLDASDTLTLEADVLVLGGGPAGTWAALAAAAKGARVVLADKGYCGSSGATAPSGVGVWYVPPVPELREAAKSSREGLGGHLSDRGWMDRVLDKTWASVNELGTWGYPFPVDDGGQPVRRSLQGPEYMRLMRKRVKLAGVRILDHSPALELLVDADGAVAGAAGVCRQLGQRWVVKAGAVVIATGGCAFLSKALGCNVLTGDGGLMAAEVGADLSGMEFSNAYAIAPAFASVTKTLFYSWATFYYEDGRVIEGAGSHRGRSIIAETLLTQPVFARIDKADEALQAWMRTAQPNFFLPFDRAGIDPFRQRFPVTLRLEGTVRGTGGIHITGSSCATSAPGLYAAGDAATRELICGGFTGGGSHNAAWAISSGQWAGEGAALFARSVGARGGQRQVSGAGRAALPASGGARQLDAEGVIRAVQGEVFPYDKNLFRTERGLATSLDRLDSLWRDVRQAGPAADVREAVRARESAAMVATARWMFNAARARTETRGMHKHTDHPSLDAAQQRRLITGGLDRVWVRAEAPAAAPAFAAAEVNAP
ncbi:pyridine nucleotide-disulfide oxidoreductase [Sorangium cellulosum]|uniref:Pyridine nucleotide-disulfide oxidoreductase n=1 Tax=Sorangium cellulosum TaxID=56 RepID=A0A2L0ES01_SORCE|nr:FAD-binding protein [Sorangium cellulosum]AUX42097.1 pyridine nucleotide-disulfide oxidoreductase [Sorangium cellulosum]